MYNKLYWKNPKCVLHPTVPDTFTYWKKWVKDVASLSKKEIRVYSVQENGLFHKLSGLNFIIFKLCCITVIQSLRFDGLYQS